MHTKKTDGLKLDTNFSAHVFFLVWCSALKKSWAEIALKKIWAEIAHKKKLGWKKAGLTLTHKKKLGWDVFNDFLLVYSLEIMEQKTNYRLYDHKTNIQWDTHNIYTRGGNFSPGKMKTNLSPEDTVKLSS